MSSASPKSTEADLEAKSSVAEYRPIHSATGPDHSSRSPEAKLFHVEFPDLHVSKENSIKFWCYQLESRLFEAEYFADEYSSCAS
jgi:hypothetical protein